MTPAEFLSAVWPTSGFYVLATPVGSAYRHRVFETIPQAAEFVTQSAAHLNLFFGIHSLREKARWNARKPDYKTGELGAYEVRSQANSHAARCFFFDLDVDPANPKKHHSQAEAVNSLRAFCKETRLPKPLIASSGTGLHVYWLLADQMLSTDWRDHARKMKALANSHQLKADPARTTDSASVLRVVGSYNLKDPENPRPVVALMRGAVTPNAAFLQALDDAIVRSGLVVTPAPQFLPDVPGLGSNLEEVYDGPPVTLRAMATACAQVRRVISLRGDVSEPEWYHTLNLVRFTENGAKLVHKISTGHAGYDPDATDAKVAQLEAKGIKPTSCAKMAEVCGDDACMACPFAGKVRSPVVAARYKDPAPTPTAVVPTGVTVDVPTIPDPPAPYIRMKDGRIAFLAKNKEGDEVHTVIYDNDLYPVQRVRNIGEKLEQQHWQTVSKREGVRDFTLDADALYDMRKFTTVIANQGIYPAKSNIPFLQDYMVAYIAELQRLANAETQYTHLGWAKGQVAFVLPDRVLQPDGSAKPVSLSNQATRASEDVCKEGTLEQQVRLLEFYNHPGYIPHQFFVLAGLAAPLFVFTGHHGVVVNASGEPGASKSTALYTAASFWGRPETYTINGTATGVTANFRMGRMETLSSLPVCLDEITKMQKEEAQNLAMGVTQPGGRGRVKRNGTEQASGSKEKATIMMTTANGSLHNLLSSENSAGTAGSMRVLEVIMRAGIIHQKYEADEYLSDLNDNYGHIGEAFIHYVVQHRDAVRERVKRTIREIDTAAQVRSSERFWSATVAAVIVAGEIAKQLGLLKFDIAAIRKWAVETQFPHMRGVITTEYTTPLGILSDFIALHHQGILTAFLPSGHSNMSNMTKAPQGALIGHYSPTEDTLWLLKSAFKSYCTRVGANHSQVLDELNTGKMTKEGVVARVVAHKNVRKVLGTGTLHAQAQSWCFAVNMAHPDIAVQLDADNAPTNTNVVSLRKALGTL